MTKRDTTTKAELIDNLGLIGGGLHDIDDQVSSVISAMTVIAQKTQEIVRHRHVPHIVEECDRIIAMKVREVLVHCAGANDQLNDLFDHLRIVRDAVEGQPAPALTN